MINIYLLIEKSKESPLARGNRDKLGLDDSPGRTKVYQRQLRERDIDTEDDIATTGESAGASIVIHDEVERRRELALRQHAFFQLRLHIRRGANLVAMDRCGKNLFYFIFFFSLIPVNFISQYYY